MNFLLLAASLLLATNFMPAGAEWVGWTVPAPNDVRVHGDRCWVGDRNSGLTISDEHPVGPGAVKLVGRIENGGLRRIEMFDVSCNVRAKEGTIHWLDNVDPGESVHFLAGQARRTDRDPGSFLAAIALHDHPSAIPALEQLAGRGNRDKLREDAVFWLGQRGGERGYRFLTDLLKTETEDTRLRKKAVFSISQSKVDAAVNTLIDLARHDEDRSIRKEAIFWLGQRAGSKAAGELRRFVDEDPDERIREQAVFAISQLPRERSVPMLIDLVRTHKSPRVREKALFWLSQTDDPRALDVIEEILTQR